MPRKLDIALDRLIIGLSVESSVALAAGLRLSGKGHISSRKNVCEYISLSQINEDTTDLFLIAFRLLDRLKSLRVIDGWCVRGDSVGMGRRNIMIAEYFYCIAY